MKYPLLLEQLAKQTPLQQQQPQAVSEDGGVASEVVATSASPEAAVIKRCVDRSREILECIDQQVADVQNKQKLAEIQGNIDTSGLERMPDHPITAEYRVRAGFLNCTFLWNIIGGVENNVYSMLLRKTKLVL